jgi:hypothetical protein
MLLKMIALYRPDCEIRFYLQLMISFDCRHKGYEVKAANMG